MAIILMEIYLNGCGFELWEYFSDNPKKSIKKRYLNIAKFVKGKKNKTIDEVRVQWKKTNAR